MKILELSRGRTLAAILLFGLLAMTARNAIDPDLWWHLRTGQWIVETGHVPHSDPFSFTRAGHAWVSHEWLSEVVFYELWKHGGTAALIVFSAIITTAGFMLLYLRCPGKTALGSRSDGLRRPSSAPSWGVRPQMFTFTLASLLLWLLEAGQDRPRLLLWIPPLFLLWLNLHAGFALGPRAVICVWRRPDHGDRRRQHALAAGTSHRSAGAAASAGLFGARASQPQRRATLSLSVRYSTLARNAVVHWRVVLAGFS